MSDISDLFARDPLSLTREDRAAIIKHFRDNREKWNATGKSPRRKAGEVPAEKLTLDSLGGLDDL